MLLMMPVDFTLMIMPPPLMLLLLTMFADAEIFSPLRRHADKRR